MSECPSCGHPVLAGILICPQCFAGLPPEPALPTAQPMAKPSAKAPPRNCLECGTANPAEHRFCQHCGIRFGEPCPWCGAPCFPEARFCGYCGQMLQAVAAARASSLPPPIVESPIVRPAAASKETSAASAEFHRQALRDYLHLWFDEEARHAVEILPGDAAFHLCQHAALLGRLSGDPNALGGLLRLDEADRERLLVALVDYLRGLSLAQSAAAILKDDAIDPDDLERLEDLLIARDGLEVTLNVARELFRGLSPAARDAVRPSIAQAFDAAAHFDDVLNDRRDVLSVIGDPLAAMSREFADGGTTAQTWWFTQPAEMAREFDSLELRNLAPEPAELAAPPPPNLPDKNSVEGDPSAFQDPFQGVMTPARGSTTPSYSSLAPNIAPSAPRAEPLHAAPPEFALMADAGGGAVRSVFLRSHDRPEFGGLLIGVQPRQFQFIALDPARQRSAALDGCEVIARSRGVETGSGKVEHSMALLTATEAEELVVRTADGGVWTLHQE